MDVTMKCVNQSLRKLRTEEFPNLVDFVSSTKNLATSLANVNENNSHIRIESRKPSYEQC